MFATVLLLKSIISDNILYFGTKFENIKKTFFAFVHNKNNAILLFTLLFTTLFSAFFLKNYIFLLYSCTFSHEFLSALILFVLLQEI